MRICAIRMRICSRKINASGDFNDEIEAAMKAAIEDFKRTGAY